MALLVWALLYLRGRSAARETVVAQPRAERHPASLTAFMPARDEVAVIEESVRSVLAQPEVGRLVVVDDGSTDGTGEKLQALSLEDPRLVVLQGEGPAEGECGKPAALDFAYRRAAPEDAWLLFVDADVVLAPGAASALLALGEERDLVTLIPKLSMKTLTEHVVMPSVGSLILAHHPPPRVSDPTRPDAFANGQVILVRRRCYEQAGGHRGVIDQVLEDVRLAERVKAAGGRLLVVDGRTLAGTRMYESWAELREGWTKNLYPLMGGRPLPVLGWVALTIGLGIAGPVALILAGWPFGVVAYLAIVGMQARLRALGGAPWGFAVFAPLGALATAYLALASMWRYRGGGGVSWKGRTYGRTPR